MTNKMQRKTAGEKVIDRIRKTAYDDMQTAAGLQRIIEEYPKYYGSTPGKEGGIASLQRLQKSIGEKDSFNDYRNLLQAFIYVDPAEKEYILNYAIDFVTLRNAYIVECALLNKEHASREEASQIDRIIFSMADGSQVNNKLAYRAYIFLCMEMYSYYGFQALILSFGRQMLKVRNAVKDNKAFREAVSEIDKISAEIEKAEKELQEYPEIISSFISPITEILSKNRNNSGSQYIAPESISTPFNIVSKKITSLPYGSIYETATGQLAFQIVNLDYNAESIEKQAYNKLDGFDILVLNCLITLYQQGISTFTDRQIAALVKNGQSYDKIHPEEISIVRAAISHICRTSIKIPGMASYEEYGTIYRNKKARLYMPLIELAETDVQHDNGKYYKHYVIKNKPFYLAYSEKEGRMLQVNTVYLEPPKRNSKGGASIRYFIAGKIQESADILLSNHADILFSDIYNILGCGSNLTKADRQNTKKLIERELSALQQKDSRIVSFAEYPKAKDAKKIRGYRIQLKDDI